MFIAALFTIARTWKQPKCPSTEEWIKKKWSTYTMEYYSNNKYKLNLKTNKSKETSTFVGLSEIGRASCRERV